MTLIPQVIVNITPTWSTGIVAKHNRTRQSIDGLISSDNFELKMYMRQADLAQEEDEKKINHLPAHADL